MGVDDHENRAFTCARTENAVLYKKRLDNGSSFESCSNRTLKSSSCSSILILVNRTGYFPSFLPSKCHAAMSAGLNDLGTAEVSESIFLASFGVVLRKIPHMFAAIRTL